MKMLPVLLFGMICVPLLATSQLIDELPHDENGNLYYSEVIQIDSASQSELYLRSKQFFANTFKSANDVIQLDDKQSGVVLGKGFQDIHIKIAMNVTAIQMWYSIKIQAKDGRYKYEIYDILFTSYPGQYGSHTSRAEEVFDKKTYFKKNGEPRDTYVKYKSEMTEKIEGLQEALRTAMAKSAGNSSKKDDW